MNAKEYVSLLVPVNERLKILQEEYEELFTAATKVTQTISDMPHGGGNDDKVSTICAKLLEISNKRSELQELKNEIMNELDKLPEREKNVLLMYYVDDMSCADIGEMLGYSEKWIQDIKYRALTLLYVNETEVCRKFTVVFRNYL